MKSMSLPGGKNRISSDEICRIIETSGKAKVTLLKWGDLEVHFQTGPSVDATQAPHYHDSPDRPTSDQPKTLSADEKEEAAAREQEDLGMLMVTDPSEHERVVIERDLGNADHQIG
jgi:hypothetical protein